MMHKEVEVYLDTTIIKSKHDEGDASTLRVHS